MKRWFHEVVLSRRWATFVTMGLAFFVFGLGSVNLFFLLKSNTQLIADYGWQALMDGGLRQLIELVATGYACVAADVVFKLCEQSLVRDLGASPSGI